MSERHKGSLVWDERGVSLITVMMVILIMTLMGISILSITGFERQISSSVSANEASVAAAEACVSTSANVLQQSWQAHVVPASLLSNAVPPGPVPFTNLAVLNSELITDGGNPDFPVGAGSAPNLTMTVAGYQVFGDIDRISVQLAPGSSSQYDISFKITCVAQNLATGLTNQVGALYVCNTNLQYCQLRPNY